MPHMHYFTLEQRAALQRRLEERAGVLREEIGEDRLADLNAEPDVAALERDVRCGYVTRDAAEECYGAVFRGDTLTIDAAATEKRRTSMREQGLPHDQPIAESLVPIAPAPHHEHNPEHEKFTEEERVAFAMQCRCCS